MSTLRLHSNPHQTPLTVVWGSLIGLTTFLSVVDIARSKELGHLRAPALPRKEQLIVKRIMLLITVAAVVAAMMAITPTNAFAEDCPIDFEGTVLDPACQPPPAEEPEPLHPKICPVPPVCEGGVCQQPVFPGSRHGDFLPEQSIANACVPRPPE